MPEPPAKPLLSIAEVAECVCVSAGTIRKWTQDGKFPEPIRLGKLVKWRRGDVQEWLDSRPEGFGGEK